MHVLYAGIIIIIIIMLLEYVAPQLYERGLYENKKLKQVSLNAVSWKLRFRSIARLERSAERILCPSVFICPSTTLSHVLLGVQCSVTVVPDMSCVPYIHVPGSYVMFVR